MALTSGTRLGPYLTRARGALPLGMVDTAKPVPIGGQDLVLCGCQN